MKNYSGNRESIRLIIVLLTFTMIIVVSMLLYLFGQLETRLAQSLKNQIQVALQIDHDRTADMVADYAFWDISYNKQITDLDLEWVDENTGRYQFESFDINLSLAMTGEHKPVFITRDGEFINNNLSEFQLNLADKIDSRKRRNEFDPWQGVLFVEGTPYFLASQFFIDEDTEEPRADFAYLVFGKRLDQSYLDQLAKTFHLPALQLIRTKAASNSCCQIDVLTFDQHESIAIQWEDIDLSSFLLKGVFFVVAITTLIGILIRIILDNTTKQQESYFQLLQVRANVDELTGISNRRDFMTRAKAEVHRAERSGKPFALLLLDIDHFKKINDKFGHSAGDIVLSEFVDLVATNLRDFDIFARYGGEEFIILLPDISAEKALEVAERIRKMLEKVEIKVNESDFINCFVSIGIAKSADSKDLTQLIEYADKSLYQAKDNGRNCSVLYHPD